MRGLKLEDDRMCFACGSKNPIGLKLEFSLDGDNVLHTEFTPKKEHQGYKDIVHGGIIALILDEVMVNVPGKLGTPVVSARFEVKLSRPARVGETIHFEARVARAARNIFYTEAKAIRDDGTAIASATGKCVRVE